NNRKGFLFLVCFYALNAHKVVESLNSHTVPDERLQEDFIAGRTWATLPALPTPIVYVAICNRKKKNSSQRGYKIPPPWDSLFCFFCCFFFFFQNC
uniref:Secreted protein n=1 Tax=Poecilia latipinna TaxID=48699 RepID=A0A3B3U2L2_9TELE